MPTITALTAERHDRERVSIYLDGEFYCGLDLETVIKNRLEVGDEIDRERIVELQIQTEKSVALEKAMVHLAASPKTKKEMITFLSKKGYVEEIVEYVIEKLCEYSYLDDSDYARRYIESHSSKKSKRLMAFELDKKGIDKNLTEELFDELEIEDDSAAKAAYEKYMKGKNDDREMKRKAFRYLLGKGFSYDAIKSVVSGEEDEDY